MYKTGDLVDVHDGLLHFRGRTDNQIKHMGHRIELEEIEHTLNATKGVERAAVVHSVSQTGMSQIVAFVIFAPEVEIVAVRKLLYTALPSYMIPGRFEIADELPRNANGKVDRSRLKKQALSK